MVRTNLMVLEKERGRVPEPCHTPGYTSPLSRSRGWYRTEAAHVSGLNMRLVCDRLAACLHSSCPYFRNELGGERERAVHADPAGSRRRRPLQALGSSCPEAMLHRPAATCGLSVLEQPRTMSHWSDTVCPFGRNGPVIEESSTGSFYYKDFFHGRGEYRYSWRGWSYLAVNWCDSVLPGELYRLVLYCVCRCLLTISGESWWHICSLSDVLLRCGNCTTLADGVYAAFVVFIRLPFIFCIRLS